MAAAALKVVAPTAQQFETARAEQPDGPRRLIQGYVRALRSLYAEEARTGADGTAWLMLEKRLVDEHGRHWQDVRPDFADRAVANTLERTAVDLIERFEQALASKTAAAPTAEFRQALRDLDRDSTSWESHGGAAYATYWLYAAVGWIGLRCARQAGVAPAIVEAVLTGQALPYPAIPEEAQGLVAAPPAAVHASSRTESKPTTVSPTIQETSAPRTLNGSALGGSVISTWLMLVVLSWVSLFWGALISAPFGVGFGILATAFAGVFIVPLWGTVFGFLGMGAARDSTLRQMGFESLPADHELRKTASDFAHRLSIPPPKLGTINACNAFAMGVNHADATVALGRPLLARLTRDEVNAVLAHELGHVVSGDMRRMMLMRTFQNATVWFAMAQGLKQFARWVICWAAELAILAFSRRREYWADAIGATLAGKEAMIGALRRLEHAPAIGAVERRQARFMFRGNAFSTHPSMAQRIAALESEAYIRRLPLKKA